MSIKKEPQPHPIKIEIKEEEGVEPTPPPQVNHLRQPQRGMQADPIEIKEEEPSNIKQEPFKKEETTSTMPEEMDIEPKEESDGLDQASRDVQKKFQYGFLKKVISKKGENSASSMEFGMYVGVAQKDKKRHKQLLEDLKGKYLKKLEESQKKHRAAVKLMRTAIKSIENDEDIPNELFRKLKNFEKMAPDQGFIENDNINNQQEPQSNIGPSNLPDFKSLLPEIQTTLDDFKDQEKCTTEMIMVLKGKWKADMPYLNRISFELDENYDN